MTATAGTDRHGTGELDRVMSHAVVDAIKAFGGYGGGVYLRSPNRHGLRLAVLAGVPRTLVRHWWDLRLQYPFPPAEAFATGHSIYLPDAEETMRRFPRMAVVLPYSFASFFVPVTDGGERYGVLLVLRASASGRPMTATERRRIRVVADRLGAGLGALAARGTPVEWVGDPAMTRLPAASASPVRIGHFDWELDSGAFDADEEMCAVLGTDTGAFGGTVAAVAAHVVPGDVADLVAAAREAAGTGGLVRHRLRVLDPEGTPRTVELWGRCPARPDGGGPRLVGTVVDLEVGAVAAEAADRLPEGVLSLDRQGRITYVNRSAEALLARPRAELLGRRPWEALSWLDDPAYEDRYRAAMLSQQPVPFVAARTPDQWLAFSLHPDTYGVTARIVPAEPAPDAGDPILPEIAQPTRSPSRTAQGPVVLAVALADAVTVGQVARVVADQVLPMFKGAELAIYVVRARHLTLAWETGYPRGFLQQFGDVSLSARLPGVDAFTTGRPIFFESAGHLASAYPGIPLDGRGAWAFLPLVASGRPVGSCILGFEHSRRFGAEERAVLTAMSGLIAQALERARLYDTVSALARGLQDALMPHQLPSIGELETVGRYLPGTQDMDIGGDWYDVIETDRGVALVIGDVQGHSVAAAATMGEVRSSVRAFATGGQPPQDVLALTNRLLIDLDPGLFATCCFVELDPRTGTAKAVRAGHPPPLLRHPGGRTEVLDLPGGVPLGVDDRASYPVTALRMPAGSVLALYTDGLVEQPETDIDTGIERLRRVLAARPGAAPLEETAERLIQEAGRRLARPDDIALLLAARAFR
ncbi:SpoIIE family protein phosphatase [Streptomyces sp. NPDC002574]|uniref:SpoIIE family protein phosphatase n=1 Tax=Streptomyces sp. NPDC002574 TaxID=3364652 RepID=UPI0036C05D39